MPPAVSVVMPFRNAVATLPACLDSVRRQSLADFELIAIDDGSEDESATLVAACARRDRRIRLLRPGRLGLVGALNLGIDEAAAALIGRMDADDLMHPQRLQAQYEYLQREPEVALVATRVELFPAERIQAGYREYLRWQNGCLSAEDVAENIYVESPFAHPSVMLRREVLLRLGGYADGPFPEDYELWLRMHRAGYRMAKLPQVLLYWRDGETRASRVDPRYSREAFDRLRAGHLARDPRLCGERAPAIWGAGRRTRQRARFLIEAGINPCAWIDIDPRKIGNRVWGIPVHAPDWLDRPTRPFVLVYVATHGARELIAERLAGLGYRPGADYLAVG
jgi:glycosyltransferase involved in cell wall biosynthesis